jgi:hypothetical protein
MRILSAFFNRARSFTYFWTSTRGNVPGGASDVRLLARKIWYKQVQSLLTAVSRLRFLVRCTMHGMNVSTWRFNVQYNQKLHVAKHFYQSCVNIGHPGGHPSNKNLSADPSTASTHQRICCHRHHRRESLDRICVSNESAGIIRSIDRSIDRSLGSSLATNF